MASDNGDGNAAGRAYWKANLRLMTFCLAIWAFVSFGPPILLRSLLSDTKVGGTDIGFWFGHQGSILVFVAIIFFYAVVMNWLDKKYGVDE